MKIILAQGNPDANYDNTRHNIGFSLIDAYARDHVVTWKKSALTKALVAEIHKNGEKVFLVKPLTYYNETGIVARVLTDYYSLTPASDLLVIHDDLSLPFGTIRVREKGSDAGNNGIKSISAHVGGEYQRLRIGIWNEQRDLMQDARFVLGKFSQEESQKITLDIIPHAGRLIDSFIDGTLEPHSTTI